MGRFGLSAAAINNTVYATGGFSQHYLSTVEAFDTVGNHWHIADMVQARSRHVIVVAQCCYPTYTQRIYAVGGVDNNGATAIATVEEYLNGTRWNLFGRGMSTGRYGHAVVAIGSTIYAFGGQNSGAQTTAERMDTGSGAWNYVPGLAEPRWDHCAAAVDKKIYVIGGYNGSTSLGTVQVYNTALQQWSPGAEMTVPRAGAVAVVHENEIFVLGGESDDGVYVNTVGRFNPMTNKWTTLEGHPTLARKYAGVAYV